MHDHAIVIADSGGVIRFWNEAAEKSFGYTAEDALGQTLDLIMPAEYASAHWTGFRQAIAAGKAAAEGNAVPFPVRGADGRITPTLGRLTLLREPGGSAIAAMVVFEKCASKIAGRSA